MVHSLDTKAKKRHIKTIYRFILEILNIFYDKKQQTSLQLVVLSYANRSVKMYNLNLWIQIT